MKIQENSKRSLRRWSARGLVAAGVSTALVLGGATAAHAEGSWKSTMTQVQPTFESRRWADKNLDSKHTVITLTNCKGNAGGKKAGTTAITSVKLTLSSGASLTHKCGTYDFGRINDGYYSFKVTAINKKTSSDRKIFLNADVEVSF